MNNIASLQTDVCIIGRTLVESLSTTAPSPHLGIILAFAFND